MFTVTPERNKFPSYFHITDIFGPHCSGTIQLTLELIGVKMKNTSTAFKDESFFESDTNHKSQILQHQAMDTPVYLKDSLQKYHYFIEEHWNNIEQLRSLKLHMQAKGKICPKA